MSNFGTFGENNPVWKALSRLGDMMIISILFVVTSLPIITIGASLSGFYFAVMDSLRKEDGYIFKRYFTSFGKNFKKATVLWLIMLVLGIVFGVDTYFWWVNREMTVGKVFLVISIILFVLWYMTLIYVFPLQARFENTIGQTLKNAFLLSLAHIPFTFSAMILIAGMIYLSYSFWIALGLMLVLGIGLFGYILVYSFERLFKKAGYIEEDDGKIKDDDYDFSVDVDFEEVDRKRQEEKEKKNKKKTKSEEDESGSVE